MVCPTVLWQHKQYAVCCLKHRLFDILIKDECVSPRQANTKASGKYRFCPHPCRASARDTFCGGQTVLIELQADWGHLLDENAVDSVCLNAECLSHTALSSLFQARVSSCSDDVTYRSCVYFKCHAIEGIQIDFRTVKRVSVEYNQP